MILLARIVSFLFHPLLMATYLMAILSQLFPAALFPIPMGSHQTIVLFVFFVTFVLPVINIAFFKFFGSLSSFAMEDRRERVIPFTFIALLYCLFTYLLYAKTRISLDDNLLKLLIIIDSLVIAAALITYFYKVSVHSMGMWGLLGIILPMNKVAEENALFVPTIILFVLCGIVMSSRLRLNAHTPREVMVGALVGLAIGFGGVLVLFK